MTLLELIKRSTDYLAAKGIDSPRLQSELLLGHVLQKPRLNLYLEFDKSLEEKALNTYRDLIKRRAKREPLQHLVGSTSFCGYPIKVSPDVLIPRPETELLAEQAWHFLTRRSQEGFHNSHVLDFGVGSGCIAISLAKKFPEIRIDAIDISPGAIAMARSNAEINGINDKIEFYTGDGFTAIPPSKRYDLIVSNPPYISSGEIANLQPEVRDHDPRIALDGGRDGLDFYRLLSTESPQFLSSDGTLMIEFGDEQIKGIENIFGRNPWNIESVVKDYSGKPRIAILKAKQTV